MKLLSTLSLLIAIACQAGQYYGAYSEGALGSAWTWFNSFTLNPFLFMAVGFLVVGCIISIFRKPDRVWCTMMLLLFVASLCIQLYVLPQPRDVIVYGLRDRLFKACTPDDLRHFARDVRTGLPLIGLSHGVMPNLKPDETAKYQQLVKTYPFMKWGLEEGDGPSLYDLDGKIEVSWGGPADGHWGFTVSSDGSKLPLDQEPTAQVIRVADDLYLFRRN